MSEVCLRHSEANFYGFSLWEFGKGPCHHFLPYLNDTASYTFKLSLRMYFCSVNHNTEAQVVFWKGGKNQVTQTWLQLDRNSLLVFLGGLFVLFSGQMEARWVSPNQSASPPTPQH